jgi:hypothetical protein
MAFDPNTPYDTKKKGVRRSDVPTAADIPVPGNAPAAAPRKPATGFSGYVERSLDGLRKGPSVDGMLGSVNALPGAQAIPGAVAKVAAPIASGLRRMVAGAANYAKANPIKTGVGTTAALGAATAATAFGIEDAEQKQEAATAAKTQAERIAANNAQGDIDHNNEMNARQEFQRRNAARQNPTQFPGGVKETGVAGVYEGKAQDYETTGYDTRGNKTTTVNKGVRVFSNDVNDPILRGGNPGRGGFVGNPKDDPNAKPRTSDDIVEDYQKASQIYQGMSDRATGLRRGGGGLSPRDQIAAQRNELMGLRLQQEARFKEAELGLGQDKLDAASDRDMEERIMELRQDPAARKDAISQLLIAGKEIAASTDPSLTKTERGRAIRRNLGLLLSEQEPERLLLRDENDEPFNKRVAGGDFKDLSVGDVEPWYRKKRKGIRVSNDGGQMDYLGDLGLAEEDLDFISGLSTQQQDQ